MKNVHKLTEGALFLATFAVLLLMTLYIPVLGIVSNLFLALPFIMFATKNDRKSSFVFFIGGLLISFIVGSILALPLTILYGLTGIVLGDCIREKKSRVSGYIAGTLAFLIVTILTYAVTVTFFNIDIIKESIQTIKLSMDQSKEILGSLGQTPDPKMMEQFEMGIDMLETLVPSLFVMSSILVVMIIELVSFPIAKRLGVAIPKWSPFRELQLPKSLLWYYLGVLVASLIFNPEEGTFWYTALINLAFVLQLFMVLQGLSLIYYFSYQKGYPKALPIIMTVLTILVPFLLSIVRILGIIDLGFDFRKRISEKK
ncbi:YybS family protein [Robertmurraya kyonggiensis]|uniref:DUF2232 domain-containing protein n=1 Tax=Robertmurraya kyonggiensis TaxID=1037680 RepID=A0A4U1D6G6_9BACI|nr:YybS family protein [Robertmurraya kyonggiensis]TKC16676.1 DUF2232 domain-containing protein [Robertmurraya kyonggiensis]